MQVPDKGRRLIVTAHAYQRAQEFRIDKNLVPDLFWESVKEKLPKDLRKNAQKNHEKYHQTTRYFRNGTYVMVAGETQDNRSGEDIYLLITIYDQRLDLHRL